jgi:hypothetical protein
VTFAQSDEMMVLTGAMNVELEAKQNVATLSASGKAELEH